ncbi:MAG TPA: hypothetical protein VIG52_05445 [Methyloceanibacter sp.]
MTTFKFPPLASVSTSLAGDHAFDSDSASPDKLVVSLGAFLVTSGSNAFGALLGSLGAWTVTINGSVVSDLSVGLVLAVGNSGFSKITVGANGQVSGGTSGVALLSSGILKNGGSIQGLGGGGAGVVFSAGGTHQVINTGTIIGTNLSIFDSDGLSSDKVTNLGSLQGGVDLNGGNDILTNSGLVSGFVDLGDGNNKLTNFGTINGSYFGGLDSDTIINTKTINGDVNISNGTNTLTNVGLVDGSYFGGTGVDTVVNVAKVGGKLVSGTIAGSVQLGGGDDHFTGGGKSETVVDNNGLDTISLGAGNDTYIATGNTGTDGLDTISASKGIDTYDASAASGAVRVNLDTVSHFGVSATTALGFNAVGSIGDKDAITGFENAKGGSGIDEIYGTAASNTLNGGGGSDVLAGFGGKDILTGGIGTDTFYFASIKDSGVTASTRDLITDFTADGAGGEAINLSQIDANTTLANDQAFTFLGTNVNFGGNAGELRAYWTATGQIIEGDVNGDKKADFSIEIADPGHAIVLSATNAVDFLL